MHGNMVIQVAGSGEFSGRFSNNYAFGQGKICTMSGQRFEIELNGVNPEELELLVHRFNQNAKPDFERN